MPSTEKNECLNSPTIRRIVPIQLNIENRNILSQFVTFRNLCDKKEHVAIIFDNQDMPTSPLVRIHSECLTGDIFKSKLCDCGLQLQESLDLLSQRGGILLYLRQEGRGIGLYNKLDTYALQLTGLDTYEANECLLFAGDLRDYKPAAEMLMTIGYKKIRLLSNNPDKELQLKKYGIEVVETVKTGCYVNEYNWRYLNTKRMKAQHKLKFNERFLDAYA